MPASGIPELRSGEGITLMKLIVAIVSAGDEEELRKAFVGSEIPFTELDGTGGFLRNDKPIFISGVPADRLEEALEIIEETCSAEEEVSVHDAAIAHLPDPVVVGGAVVFIIDIEAIHRF